MMTTVCPVCGKDEAIQKVSAVVVAGESSGSFSGPTGGLTYVGGKWGAVGGYTVLGGTTTSKLAEFLSPPRQPGQEHINEGCTVGCMAAMFLFTSLWFALVGYVIGTETGDETLAVIFGIGFAVAFFILAMRFTVKQIVKRNDKWRIKFEKESAEWKKVHALWSNLYYCFRDDVVFDPETGEHRPPAQLKELLYPNPP